MITEVNLGLPSPTEARVSPRSTQPYRGTSVPSVCPALQRHECPLGLPSPTEARVSPRSTQPYRGTSVPSVNPALQRHECPIGLPSPTEARVSPRSTQPYRGTSVPSVYPAPTEARVVLCLHTCIDSSIYYSMTVNVYTSTTTACARHE